MSVAQSIYYECCINLKLIFLLVTEWFALEIEAAEEIFLSQICGYEDI